MSIIDAGKLLLLLHWIVTSSSSFEKSAQSIVLTAFQIIRLGLSNCSNDGHYHYDFQNSCGCLSLGHLLDS